MIIHVPRRHRLVISVNCPSHYEVADITRPSRAAYAKKHNADFIEILDDAFPDFPMMNKYRISRYAENYYQTAYFDGDVIIKDDAPNIFEADEPHKIMFRDELPIIMENNSVEYVNRMNRWARIVQCPKPAFCPNAGVLVLPNNMVQYYRPPEPDIKEKLDTLWCMDQSHLACILTKYKLLDKIAFLSEEYHLCYIQKDFWQKLETCGIIHLNGSQNGKYRADLARRIMAGNYEFFLPEGKQWLPNWDSLKGKK